GITLDALRALGDPRLRGGDTPFISDNGNYIVDLAVAPIVNPGEFETGLAGIPGALASGLFVGIADAAYVAGASGLRRLDAAGSV
ncbi:MAG: ribose 5-phosphate isomerase A, partial [Acidimicrobiia bacterium]|nr:ribose 5-phosphate isomerase A [Acidimicrobiia bacterium]